MRLIYFEGEHGIIGLVPEHVVGFEELDGGELGIRSALLTSGGHRIKVRNAPDEVQCRLMEVVRVAREPVIPKQPHSDSGR